MIMRKANVSAQRAQAARVPASVARKAVSVRASAETSTPSGADMFNAALNNNRLWSEAVRSIEPQFFTEGAKAQYPKFLWLGCADSRVPANQVLGLSPGEVFVQRNVGNQVHLNDMNVMSCLEFGINALGCKVIIVCGHYNCGAVKGAITLPASNASIVNCWIHDIRQCRDVNRLQLEGLSLDDQVNRLAELNVLRQVHHVVNSFPVQGAWADGKDVTVYGCIYNLATGNLNPLIGPLTKDSDLSALQATVIKTTNSPGEIKTLPGNLGKQLAAK